MIRNGILSNEDWEGWFLPATTSASPVQHLLLKEGGSKERFSLCGVVAIDKDRDPKNSFTPKCKTCLRMALSGRSNTRTKE